MNIAESFLLVFIFNLSPSVFKEVDRLARVVNYLVNPCILHRSSLMTVRAEVFL